MVQLSDTELQLCRALDAQMDEVAARELWCAVLMEMYRCAMRKRRSDYSFQINEARRWFGTRDFYEVCRLAGVDGDYILDGVRRAAARVGWQVA